ncbi:MAG: hypothetical protein ABJL54_09490 [Halioglobus sp.]
MIRNVILISLMVMASTAVKAEIDPSQVTYMALAQIQDCLDLGVSRVMTLPAMDARSGLSFRGLGATLGIGVMTLLFFVPAALLSELLMRRGETRGSSETA